MRADVTRRIKQLGRAGKPREAVAELANMARLGIQPDTLAATALVDACARNGKMDMARRWARRRGLRRNSERALLWLSRVATDCRAPPPSCLRPWPQRV